MLDSLALDSSSRRYSALVFDPSELRWLPSLSELDAYVLKDCCGEDPANWADLALVWPRYSWHSENARGLDALTSRRVTPAEANERLAGASHWFVIDLVQQRLFLSDSHPRVVLSGESPAGRGRDVEHLLLPPWWTATRVRSPEPIWRARRAAAERPAPHREVLWGPPWVDDCAARLTREWTAWRLSSTRQEASPAGYQELVRIHRGWLMTPRDDLQGGRPRDCLHGGTNWIAELADGQRWRILDGQPLIATPGGFSNLEQAAFGRHEVIFYFRATRMLLQAGWCWLEEQGRPGEDESQREELKQAMERELAAWLDEPMDDGVRPREVIACERARNPLLSGGQHRALCDCPICEVLASGEFGPQLLFYSGLELELDDEFAFSLGETMEQWNELRPGADALGDPLHGGGRFPQPALERFFSSPPRELEGAVSLTGFSSGAFGVQLTSPDKDVDGNLPLAFAVANFIGALQSGDAPPAEADSLQWAFRRLLHVKPRKRRAAARKFLRLIDNIVQRDSRLCEQAGPLRELLERQAKAPAGP